MVRRSSPVLAAILAMVFILLAAVPASAYNNVNPYHLRLTRLDPLECGSPIRILAKLTDDDGHAVSGKTVHFEITEGRFGDRLSPHYVTTDSRGKAITVVNLACWYGSREVEITVTGPNHAAARISLVLRRHDDHHDGDHWWGSRDTAAGLAVTTGSNGDGTGPQAPVSASRSVSVALLPVGPVIFGVMILMATRRRRTTLRAARQATT